MLSAFQPRPAERDILYLNRDHRNLTRGDWVLLQDVAGDAFWVEVRRTDADPPHAHFEGVVRGLDSPLGIETRPLVHQGLDIGDRISFEAAQVLACAPEKPGFVPARFSRRHLGPAERVRL